MDTVAAVFGVRPDQWEDFLEMMEDSDTNYSSWAEWKENLDQLIQSAEGKGVTVEVMDVDLTAFAEWCNANALKMEGSSRSRYAAVLCKSKDKA